MMLNGALRIESAGIQSAVYTDGKQILKQSGKGLPRNILESFAKATPTYRKELEKAGLSIPKNIRLEVTDCLETLDEMLPGQDVDKIIKRGGGADEWGEMVKTIVTKGTSVALDAKAPNFIFNDKGQFYIDTYPPLLQNKQKLITPWVPAVYKRDRLLMSFNYGDTRGQITKLLALARREYPNSFTKLTQITLNQVANPYITEQVELNFPDMGLFYSDRKDEAHERLKFLMYG